MVPLECWTSLIIGVVIADKTWTAPTATLDTNAHTLEPFPPCVPLELDVLRSGFLN